MSGTTLRERLAWAPGEGAVRDGEVRYLLLRADTLMTMFALLPAEERARALAALAEAVRRRGGDSARRYMAGLDGPDELYRAVAETAAQLGWGAWTFRRGAGGPPALTVRNSPFAEAYGPSATPVCAAIAGMLAAVAEAATGRPHTAEETRCRAGGAASCRFRAVPAISRRAGA